MAEIHTYPEMNAKIKDLLRIGEQPICLYAAKRIEELEEYERRKGEWQEYKVIDIEDTTIEEVQSQRCSVCSRYLTTPYLYYFKPYNFCPNCGANMKGVGNG